jgi:hypothetical protein
VCAVQAPDVPYLTTPWLCPVVAQLTWTEEAVRSLRYGARVRAAAAPDRLAPALPATMAMARPSATAGRARVARGRGCPTIDLLLVES